MNNIQQIAKAYIQSLQNNPGKHAELQNALADFLKNNHLEKQGDAVLNAVRKQLKANELHKIGMA